MTAKGSCARPGKPIQASALHRGHIHPRSAACKARNDQLADSLPCSLVPPLRFKRSTHFTFFSAIRLSFRSRFVLLARKGPLQSPVPHYPLGWLLQPPPDTTSRRAKRILVFKIRLRQRGYVFKDIPLCRKLEKLEPRLRHQVPHQVSVQASQQLVSWEGRFLRPISLSESLVQLARRRWRSLPQSLPSSLV
jgi:hypothetical protein